MLQPERFQQDQRVCRLRKSLYGLKQASRVWNEKLDQSLKEIDLQRSKVDPCIYYDISASDIVIVAIYVDDILIFWNNLQRKNQIKKELKIRFKMKDLGEARQVLGM